MSLIFRTSPFLEKAREYRIDSIRATFSLIITIYFNHISHSSIPYHPHVSACTLEMIIQSFLHPRVNSKLLHIFGISCGFETLYTSGDIFFFYLFFSNDFVFSLPSFLLHPLFFFLFIQRIHRCGYTKLERYYFCLHVNE